MRIRYTFAAAFLLLSLLSAYLGFANVKVPVNDKALHFVTFFALTLIFYWILETSRRRVLNITLVTCTLIGGIGSEFAQSFVPYREFDLLDIAANLVGSGLALGICAWYHKRMMERKRGAKKYQPVATEDDDGGEELEDLERERGPEDVEALAGK
ncbi:hypothetical protein RUND412_005080 [Rhizina undulata]